MASQETIACCVGSPTASWTVKQAIRAAGVCATTVNRTQLERGDASRWSALIFELRASDSDAKAAVSAFRERQPGTPVLLYAPMSANTEPLLEQLLGREGVYLHIQCDCTNQIQPLRENICRVLGQAPGIRIKAMIEAALPGMPARLKDYINRTLTALGTDNGPLQLTTATVAGDMGLVVRTLERTSAAAGYPRPKELLSWMVLLYLTLIGCSNQMTPYRVARRLGMSTCTMNRLRQRLLSPIESEAWKRNRADGLFQLELVFRAFVVRCGSPAKVASETLKGTFEPRRGNQEQHLKKAVSGM